ncbi:MAG: FCD domain-containing protein [Rhodobacteraceae bacterium]|nr:FCD domain-containing protein [Paracoccaceae bacterium]
MVTQFPFLERQAHEPIAAFVQRALRTAIITHRMQPGEMLSEQEIARRFDISRQPVREAFIKLSEAGLVRVLPQRGTQVARISMSEVNDARFVRQAVEIAIAAEAARQITEPGRRALEQHLARQQEAAEREAEAREEAREQFYFLDEAFHAELALIAKRPAAWKLLENVKAQMDRVRFLAVELISPLDRIIAQHRAIMAAVKSGDPVAASEAMRAHLDSILSELPELRRQFVGHFVEES